MGEEAAPLPRCSFVPFGTNGCHRTVPLGETRCPEHAGQHCAICGQQATHHCHGAVGSSYCALSVCDDCDNYKAGVVCDHGLHPASITVAQSRARREAESGRAVAAARDYCADLHTNPPPKPETTEPRPGHGVLFKNGRKRNDTHPDYKGSICLADGSTVQIAGWVTQGKTGKYLALKAEAVALREQAETEAQAVVQAQHRLDAHQAHLDELVRQLTTQKAQQEEQAAQLAARQRDIEHRELVGTTGTGNIPSPKLKKVLPR